MTLTRCHTTTMSRTARLLCLALFSLAAPAWTQCMGTPATLTAGVYTARLQSGKALDAEGGGRFDDGAPVQIWDFHGGANQRWLITPVGEGRYLVRSAMTAKAVDAAFGCFRSAGCRIITWNTNRGPTQIWRIEQTGSLHRLLLADGGQQLGIGSDVTRNGSRAVTGVPGCGPNQLWRLERVGNYRELTRDTGLGLLRMEVRLNNYTSVRHQFDASGERAYFRPNDSRVTFRFGSRTFGPFAINTPVLELGPDRMFKTYVNDWNSNRTAISGDRGRVKITVGFEDNGVEIITNCYNNLNCHIGEPRFDFRNTRLEVFLQPRFDTALGRFTYDADSQFHTEIAESGPCVNNFWAFLCNAFVPDRGMLIRDNLIRLVNANLNRGIARVGLETFLNSLASGAAFRDVVVGDTGELIFH